MLIDNSAANTWRTCPLKYYYSYEMEGIGIEQIPNPLDGYTPLQFGSRVHELLQEHYDPKCLIHPESEIAALEIEAQMMMTGYKTHYGVEEIEIVDVEHQGKVPLPNSDHEYVFRIDLCYRNPETGRLRIRDHKTQNRNAKSNDPRKWAARDQATLYLWAAEQLYGEPIEGFEVNVLIRQSPAGREPATFPDRQKLERTPEQLVTAVRDITWVANQITAMREQFKGVQWPSNKEECFGWGQCEFYLPDTYGWSPEIREQKYQPKTPYIEGLNIIS